MATLQKGRMFDHVPAVVAFVAAHLATLLFQMAGKFSNDGLRGQQCQAVSHDGRDHMQHGSHNWEAQ